MADAGFELSDFLTAWAQGRPVGEETDLLDDLGLDGDDAFEFIEAFAERFGVDLTDYRWYFHHGEEGWGLGALFFRSPDRRVTRIPITPSVLAEAIGTRRWPIRYPDHVLPKVRWDIRVNQAFVLVPLALLALWAWALFAR